MEIVIYVKSIKIHYALTDFLFPTIRAFQDDDDDDDDNNDHQEAAHNNRCDDACAETAFLFLKS